MGAGIACDGLDDLDFVGFEKPSGEVKRRFLAQRVRFNDQVKSGESGRKRWIQQGVFATLDIANDEDALVFEGGEILGRK